MWMWLTQASALHIYTIRSFVHQEQRLHLQAQNDTYLQLEFWDENRDLIKRSAELIRKADRQHKVILGSPFNTNIWRICGEELPEAPRILPQKEVGCALKA